MIGGDMRREMTRGDESRIDRGLDMRAREEKDRAIGD